MRKMNWNSGDRVIFGVFFCWVIVWLLLDLIRNLDVFFLLGGGDFFWEAEASRRGEEGIQDVFFWDTVSKCTSQGNLERNKIG